jgi:hypothetical protein
VISIMIHNQDEVPPVSTTEKDEQAELSNHFTNSGAFDVKLEAHTTTGHSSLDSKHTFSSGKLAGDQLLQTANSQKNILPIGDSSIDSDPFAGMFVEIPVLTNMQNLMMSDGKHTTLDEVSQSGFMASGIIESASNPEDPHQFNLVKHTVGDDATIVKSSDLKALSSVNTLPFTVDKSEKKDCDGAVVRHDECQTEQQKHGNSNITGINFSHADQGLPDVIDSGKASIVTSSGVDQIKDSIKLVGALKNQGHSNPLGQSVDKKLLEESQSSVTSSVIGLPTADSMGSMCTQPNKSKKEATLDLIGGEHLGLEGSEGPKSLISDKLEPQIFDDSVPSVKSLGGSPLSHDSDLVGAVTMGDTVIDSKLSSSVMQLKKTEPAKPAEDGLNQISSILSEPIVAMCTETKSLRGKNMEKDNLIEDFEEAMNSSMSAVSVGKASLVADPFMKLIGDKKILPLSGSTDDDLKNRSEESVYPSSLISIEESEDNAAVLPIPVNNDSKPRIDSFVEPEFLKRNHQNVGTGEKIAFNPADADF